MIHRTATGARVDAGRHSDRSVPRLCGVLAGVLMSLIVSTTALAQFDPTDQDIDLFMINPGSSGERTNVLILLDNTANWSQPFVAEKTALTTVAGTLTEQFNVGLMLFPETGSPNDSVDGGYVRFGVRSMNETNRTAFASLIGGLDRLADKGNNATFSLLMYEAYAYFAGITARAGFGKVKRDYAPSPMINPYNPIASALPGNPLSSSLDRTYQTPITDACQKNFVIVISNGPASDNASSLAKAKELLTGIQRTTPTQINIPAPYDGSENNWTDEYARYMSSGDCNPNIEGIQRVNTFVIEVNPGTTRSALDHTALMKSTAAYGKGRYFAVDTGPDGEDGSQLAEALQRILTEIKAVNSVYASTTLPVSLNVRGTNANQVYMGIFRPDETLSPRWFGNMKLYKVGVDTSVSPPDLFLADAAGQKAESTDTGFIIPQARSFWTEPSSFWSFRGVYEDTDLGRESDSPDGPYVEKGGAAQQQRDIAPAERRLFTCAGGCSSGEALSSHLFAASNADITTAALGAASAAERSLIIAWTRGEDVDDENANGVTTDARASIHGDVLHSRPAVVNYNRSGTNDDNDVFVFYGANDGVLRALEGGFDSTAGRESWGFVAPEHFDKLKRIRDNTVPIGSANKKPYFFDGGLVAYTHDVNSDGRLVAADGDKVFLFASMRRGGRQLYAFDVSDPANPKFLWSKGCPNETGNSGCDSGYEGIGQTWSVPTVTFLRAFSTSPVLVVGGGYDAAPDDVSPCLTTSNSATSVSKITGATVVYGLDGTCAVSGGTAQVFNRTMGRAVFIIDAMTGEVLQKIGAEPGSDLPVPGMSYAIAGEVVALNRDRDVSRPVTGRESVGGGYADRLYAVDAGGNIWRVDVSDADTSNWRASQLAALGGGGAVPRRFLHRVDVVYAKDANGPYDAVLIGSGDREHPFDTSVTNRFYMIKDRDVAATMPATLRPTIVESELYDASANCLQQCTGATLLEHQAQLLAAKGWYFDLRPGEKTVGASTTISGIVFFNTNQPSSTACASTLGVARAYEVSYTDASARRDLDLDGTVGVQDRSVEHVGGGLLPEPVPILVDLRDDASYEGASSGTSVFQGAASGSRIGEVPAPPFGARLRTFWRKRVD